MNLLLVDDEVIEIEALEVSIPWKQMGFSCIFHSYNIKEAKKILTTQDIHLMISDIEMPHGSGLELLKWTRENCPHVVCNLFTCHADFINGCSRRIRPVFSSFIYRGEIHFLNRTLYNTFDFHRIDRF